MTKCKVKLDHFFFFFFKHRAEYRQVFWFLSEQFRFEKQILEKTTPETHCKKKGGGPNRGAEGHFHGRMKP